MPRRSSSAVASSSAVSSTPGIGTRVRVWFDGDARWFEGTVSASTRGRGTQIRYDPVAGEDDLVTWHDLSDEKFEIIGGGAESKGASSSTASGTAVAPAVSAKAAGKAVQPPTTRQCCH